MSEPDRRPTPTTPLAPPRVALETLELPAVRAMLAERTSFAPGRELALTLEPTSDLRDAERLQDETAAARELVRGTPSAGLAGARDIRDAIRRARLGGVLDVEQLLAVASTVRAAEQLFGHVHPFPPLAAHAHLATPPAGVAGAIEHAIGGTGEVLDRASAKLGGLRAELRAAQARLQQRIDGLVRSPDLAPHLQEMIVTQRGGRYVVPVKASSRGAVKGIVHDQSASGQTVFVEPLEILEANNKVREAELAEQAELQRILDELSRRVESSSDDLAASADALAALDVILAKALFAEALECERPALNDRGILDLRGARHPLLVDRGGVVPIDVRLGTDFRVLVITGPNTGGKTVTLKTIGLLVLMAACGLQLPAARGSAVPVVRRVFADIGDEQSIAQSLSTFSSHLRNVVATLAGAERGDLALLDEVGAGTDPDQGAALAMAVLETLLERGVLVAASTHYPELKAFALNTPGVSNASVEFDAETLRPTYRVHVGLPGASNAFAIASRLGLDGSVLERATAHLSDLHHSLERTLREAERQRITLATALEEAQQAATDARAVTSAARREAGKAHEDAAAVLDRARAEAEGLLLQARRALRAAQDARERGSRRDMLEDARNALADAEAAKRASLEDAGADTPSRPAGDDHVEVGGRVLVEGVSEPGTLLSVDDRGMAEVASGPMRLRVPRSSLRRAEASAERPAPSGGVWGGVRPHPDKDLPLQLDLRGARAEDALATLDRYLNDAALAGYERIRIVHGKGTGALRAAVREALGKHPLVREQEPAARNEGGEGATIVKL